MHIGLAADHAGFCLKAWLEQELRAERDEIVDFGATQSDPDTDFPRFVIPLAQAVARGEVQRGEAIAKIASPGFSLLRSARRRTQS